MKSPEKQPSRKPNRPENKRRLLPLAALLAGLSAQPEPNLPQEPSTSSLPADDEESELSPTPGLKPEIDAAQQAEAAALAERKKMVKEVLAKLQRIVPGDWEARMSGDLYIHVQLPITKIT